MYNKCNIENISILLFGLRSHASITDTLHLFGICMTAGFVKAMDPQNIASYIYVYKCSISITMVGNRSRKNWY